MLWEKEKLLVTGNFSFSHSVFKRLVLQTLKNQGLFRKGSKDFKFKDQFCYFCVFLTFRNNGFPQHEFKQCTCSSRISFKGIKKKREIRNQTYRIILCFLLKQLYSDWYQLLVAIDKKQGYWNTALKKT